MRSTFSRIFFPTVLLLLAALFLVGIAFQILVRNYLNGQALDDLENDGQAIASLASAYYTEGSLTGKEFFINLSVATQVSNADAVLFDSTGRLILCSDSPLGCEHRNWMVGSDYVKQVLRSGVAKNTGAFTGLYNDVRYVVSVPILDAYSGKGVGIVMVSAPMNGTLTILEKLSDIYLFVSALVVVITVILTSLLARENTKTLREMAKTASAFGHGDLDARVQIKSSYPQETEELALAFNNMASSLQKSEYRRQEFVANVSHELKTPMTTIGGYIDGILDGTIPQEKHRHYMQIVSDETKRLSRLVRSMLDISRMQGQEGFPPESIARFDLCECIGMALITFEQKINEKGLEVSVDFPEHPVFTVASQDAVTQIVYNLLDNAVKFSPQGGKLSLAVRVGGGKAYLSISNEGATIPAQELPLVFDRFHKIDKSRSQNRDGWGLGLYIVKTIVCSHGEDISVSSVDGKTEFTFTLPLVN